MEVYSDKHTEIHYPTAQNHRYRNDWGEKDASKTNTNKLLSTKYF